MKIYALTCTPPKNYQAIGVKNQNHKFESANLKSEPNFKGPLSGALIGSAAGTIGVCFMWLPMFIKNAINPKK